LILPQAGTTPDHLGNLGNISSIEGVDDEAPLVYAMPSLKGQEDIPIEAI